MKTPVQTCLLIAMLTLSASAFAVRLECKGATGSMVIDESSGAVLQRTGPGFSVQGSGIENGTLTVSGHALAPKITYVGSSGEIQTCAAVDDARSLFERLIDNPMTLQALARWRSWSASRAAVCAAELDSQVFVQPGSTKVAVVLHGYASSPEGMLPVIRLLLDQGYNVFAPRLSRHYTTNLRDLDNAAYQEWVADSETAFAIASSISPKTTLAGYSLGGLLASRLALQHPKAVDRLVLIAPAWRLTNSSDFASVIGSVFKISLNEFQNTPIACRANAGFVSGIGGRQVEELAVHIENENDVYNMQQPYPSAYNKISARQLVITSDIDEAVDSEMIGQICAQVRPRCEHVAVASVPHIGFVSQLSAVVEGTSNTLSSVISKFLR